MQHNTKYLNIIINTKGHWKKFFWVVVNNSVNLTHPLRGLLSNKEEDSISRVLQYHEKLVRGRTEMRLNSCRQW